MFRIIRILVVGFWLGACVEVADTGVKLTELPDGDANCPNGGYRLVTYEGKELKESFICRDSSTGTPGATVTVENVAAGEECPHGGQSIRVQEPGEAPQVSYVCNGENGAAGSGAVVAEEPSGANCPEGGVRITGADGAPVFLCNDEVRVWKDVAADFEPEPNHGYMANATGDIVMTLSASGEFEVGDSVELVNLGKTPVFIEPPVGGGFKAAEGVLAPATSYWSVRGEAKDWRAIAMSSDGQRLIAGATGERLYLSEDEGRTWKRAEVARSWVALASSADGKTLWAAASDDYIRVSTDYGVTWTSSEQIRKWASLATSADGSRVVAGASGGYLYVSKDGGTTWTSKQTDTTRNWTSVTMSDDGNRIVAVGRPGLGAGYLFRSTDGGETWVKGEQERTWWGVASSADGVRLVASESDGYLYTSSDAGATWSPRGGKASWANVASSASGDRLVAVKSGNPASVYTSTNGGMTWTPRSEGGALLFVSLSAAGARLAAAYRGGQVYVNGNGNLVVHPSSSIELLHTGGGEFYVRHVVGEVEGP